MKIKPQLLSKARLEKIESNCLKPTWYQPQNPYTERKELIQHVVAQDEVIRALKERLRQREKNTELWAVLDLFFAGLQDGPKVFNQLWQLRDDGKLPNAIAEIVHQWRYIRNDKDKEVISNIAAAIGYPAKQEGRERL